MSDFDRGQWAAFERVLHWLNELEDTTLRKTDVYAHVMSMRPE